GAACGERPPGEDGPAAAAVRVGRPARRRCLVGPPAGRRARSGGAARGARRARGGRRGALAVAGRGVTMAGPRVVVLDYGSGNLRSVQRALTRAGADVTVTSDLAAAGAADGLVVPGVGAFAACMAGVTELGAGPVITDRVAAG